MEFIHEQFSPYGIVVTGTIVRGDPDPASDLDIVVVHKEPWRQRVQCVFDGVPVEMFVNPPAAIRRSYTQEAVAGRAVMAHMMTTGQIVRDVSGIMDALRREAQESLAAGPQMPRQEVLLRQYAVATAFEDAGDVIHRDPDLASAVLIEAVMNATRLAFLQAGQWQPRAKDLLLALENLDAVLGQQARAVLNASSVSDRLELARPVVQAVTGATGFFAWESDRQPVDDELPGRRSG
jgi:hypothetical protein